MARENYPTQGYWRLREVNGDLYYKDVNIGPQEAYSRVHFGRMRKALAAEGIMNPRLYSGVGISRCRNCQELCIGSGKWCSLECKRAEKAARQRARRAALRTLPTVCLVCGGPLISQRKSRRVCSSACRQKAYRQRSA